MRIVDTFCQLCTILFLKNIVFKLYEKYNDVLFNQAMDWYTINSNSMLCGFLLKFISDSIYLYSFAEIFYINKVKPSVNALVTISSYFLEKYKFTKTFESSIKYSIKVYKNNILTHNLVPSDNISDLLKKANTLKDTLKNEIEYLIIVTIHYNKLNEKELNICYNKLCYEVNDREYNLLFFSDKLSSLKFLYVTLTYNNETYTIDLSTDNFNFYIVGNIIDKVFVLYYLKYIVKLDTPLSSLDEIIYSISICDQNANFVTITNDDIIIIEENDYKIKHIKQDESKEKNDNDETDFILT